jgi:hypothetical protein
VDALAMNDERRYLEEDIRAHTVVACPLSELFEAERQNEPDKHPSSTICQSIKYLARMTNGVDRPEDLL